MTSAEFAILHRQVQELGKETEWLEWKENKAVPEEIGKNLSALANSAALHEKAAGYIVWGLEDQTCEVVGTSFRPRRTKHKGQSLEFWLAQNLDPSVDFHIHELEYQGRSIVIFEVLAATNQLARFSREAYIRIGSCTTALRNHSEKERTLWQRFARTCFEEGVAAPCRSPREVFELIDHSACFTLTEQPTPSKPDAILERLTVERILTERFGTFEITNLGAILFARDLRSFPRLHRKTTRVIKYENDDRLKTTLEEDVTAGYAIGFPAAISFINSLLPQHEQIGQALRTIKREYPEIAVRELVINALMHQDFSVRGAGPTVELFSNRLEITNPGRPLVDPLRFIDVPPQSRNEQLASLMRRMNMCEERGGGIDKAIAAIEQDHLPAPLFETRENNTCAVLFAHQPIRDLDKPTRIRACYQHACMCAVARRPMTNRSLRARFGLEDSNTALISSIIRGARDAELIKEADPTSKARKHRRYLPFWA